jgi:hypothetical protein
MSWHRLGTARSTIVLWAKLTFSARHAIKTDSSQLRSIISAPDFTKLFGPASADGKGKGARCNVFGHDDQLKVAPKGVAKDHKDIDLLKLRSIAVVKKWVLFALRSCCGSSCVYTTALPMKRFSARTLWIFCSWWQARSNLSHTSQLLALP